MVTYVRKLPVSVLDQPMGYLIIELNDRAFFDVFSHMTLGSSGEMLIATPSGNIFSDWNKDLLGPDLHSPLIQKLLATTKPEDRFSEKIDGRTMLVNYLQSSYSGWKYISVLPVEELTGHFDWIKQMMIGLGLFLIAVSLLAVFWLSRSFFGLWHGLLELLRRGGREDPAPAAGRLNEFGLIRHYVESLHRTNDELEKQVQDSMPLLRTHFLRRVLNEAMKEEELGQRFGYYSLPMEGRYYAVMCLELDDLRGQTEQDLNLFGYAVNNIAREVISHHAEGAVFQTGTEQTAVILNLGGEETSAHDAQAAVFSVAEEMHRVIGELLKVTVTIGIGRCYPCRTRIRSSYREAKEALEFQLVEGNDKVIFIGSVLPQRSAFFYPAEQELTVVTGLKLCRLEQIRQGTDQFAAKLTACGRQASVDHIQQSFVQLVAASLKTLFELDPEGGPKLFAYNLYQRLAQLKTGDAIVQWLGTEVYPAMVAHISGFRNQRQRKTMEKVLQFIHEHYDEDLSQPMLADLVSLPGSQFSSMFKEETGMTLTDYIIAYRMDRAKELLVTTDLKVGDIADRLSYNNAQNFIRVFKRICGITPGEYRTQHASSDRAG
ncbi:helix-turn-helix domain-containing protein [Paenibacillus sp. CC-CFT747]|nr:helix-turn-helix domain-containing protein [Paenibacillus sp. CC-CFT747]